MGTIAWHAAGKAAPLAQTAVEHNPSAGAGRAPVPGLSEFSWPSKLSGNKLTAARKQTYGHIVGVQSAETMRRHFPSSINPRLSFVIISFMKRTASAAVYTQSRVYSQIVSVSFSFHLIVLCVTCG